MNLLNNMRPLESAVIGTAAVIDGFIYSTAGTPSYWSAFVGVGNLARHADKVWNFRDDMSYMKDKYDGVCDLEEKTNSLLDTTAAAKPQYFAKKFAGTTKLIGVGFATGIVLGELYKKVI